MTRIAGRRHTPDPPFDEDSLASAPDTGTEAEIVRLLGLQLKAQTRMYARVHFILNVVYGLLWLLVIVAVVTFAIIVVRSS
jgi:hypothetical protein